MSKVRKVIVSSSTSDTAVRWINQGLESLWLLTVVSVPLVFVSRDYMVSEAAIAYLEIPKIAVLRTLVGLMSILWLIEWGIRGRFYFEPHFWGRGSWLRPGLWLPKLRDWLAARPARWLALAVAFYLATTLLSTLLSASFSVSMWGDVPGEDGYATYTILAYILLFAVVATHLKTWPQLWRLLGAIVAVGVAVGGYGMLQQYGLDLWRLQAIPTNPAVSSTIGNPILTAALLLMTITVSLAVATSMLREAMGTVNFWAKAGLWTLVLMVQLLGIIATLSRGPWMGTIAALVVFLGLTALSVDWRKALRVCLLLGLTVMLPWLALVTTSRLPVGSNISIASVSPTVLAERFSSTRSEVPRFAPQGPVAGGGLSGRVEFWKGSWGLMLRHPWFGFEELSLSWLRPFIGYGPDLFRVTYLLESPPSSRNLLPKGPRHAHNLVVHQGVEQGFLGVASILGVMAAFFLVGCYQLIRERRDYSTVHKLILIGLIGALAGRFVEQGVGVARVSDLTVFWVLLAAFVALGNVRAHWEPVPSQPAGSRRGRRSQPRRHVSSPIFQPQLIGRLMTVAFLISVIGTMTWVKTLNYPRAAVAAGEATASASSLDLQARLDALDRAIRLAPDVFIYYQYKTDVYWDFRNNEEGVLERECGFRSAGQTYQECLAQQIYINSQEAAKQRPFDYRTRLGLAEATLALASHSGDPNLAREAIELFREAVEMVPNSWPAWNFLAEIYNRAGQPDAALEFLGKSLAITGANKPSEDALLKQGVFYRQMGQKDRALAALTEASRVSPNNYRVYHDLGALYYELRQYENAIQEFSRAIELYKGYSKAYYGRGTTYDSLDQPLQAIKDLDIAVGLDPLSALAYNRRGDVYAGLGEFRSAIQDFDEAIRLDPELVVAYKNRAIAYLGLGQPERAIGDLDRAILLNPQYSTAYLNRALVYTSLGMDEAAYQDAERAVALGVDEAFLQEQIEEIKNIR